MTVPDLRILEHRAKKWIPVLRQNRCVNSRASVPIPPQPILLWTSRILEPGPVGSGFSVPKKDVAHGSQRRTDSGALRSLAVEMSRSADEAHSNALACFSDLWAAR